MPTSKHKSKDTSCITQVNKKVLQKLVCAYFERASDNPSYFAQVSKSLSREPGNSFCYYSYRVTMTSKKIVNIHAQLSNQE